jgi:hypothetical protein
MRLALAAALLVTCLAGCGQDHVAGATPPSPTIYTATLTASSACAAQLPAELGIRVYEAKLDGSLLLWSAPTMQGQYTSTLKVVGDTVSLDIGRGWIDPQGDIFYGLWEKVGDRELTIDGNGSGRIEGSVMSGTFRGHFDSWSDYAGGPAADCQAADHHFALTPR